MVFYAVSRGFPLAQNIRFSMFRTTTSSISCSENVRFQPHFLLRSGSLQSKLGTTLGYSRFELVSGRPDCKCLPHIFRYPGEHRCQLGWISGHFWVFIMIDVLLPASFQIPCLHHRNSLAALGRLKASQDIVHRPTSSVESKSSSPGLDLTPWAHPTITFRTSTIIFPMI